jgi:enterobactin synthetase component F
LARRLAQGFAANGGKLAVADGERSLTFAELDQLSTRVAAALLRRPDSASLRSVGIHLAAGVDWVVAALGCLRAGIPYLALDPADPADYRESVRQAAKCTLVISSGDDAAGSVATTLKLESLCSTAADASSVPLPDVDAASLATAYLLYTSGSTGTPKIVAVPHEALFNCIDSMMRAYPFVAGDVIGMRTKPTFAPAVKQWLGAVLAGLPVIVLPARLQGAAALADRIRESSITRLYLVPTQIKDLAHHLRAGPAPLDSVRLLTTGGEPLLPELLGEVRAAFPAARLLNNYGCSELADITFNEVVEAPDAIAVGTPIDNTSVYLLRDDLEPVGAGAVGQIFVSGAALGSSYFDRADLTAAAFLPDPFSRQPGARMFRTGDYGRVDSRGKLIHGGRRDQQLKVNGCRVDAGHVASVLLSNPTVERALALTRPGRQGEELLVAYVTPRLTPAAVVSLRRYLLTRLPHSMQPGAIVSLDAFPLLANGKVDRRALAAPDWDAVTSDRVAPRSPTERAVADIWKEVLGVTEVGIDDNFFNLGGHSILVIRVLVQIKATFGIELSQATFFQAPTIAELAARLESQDPENSRASDWNASASARASAPDNVT